MTGRFLIESGAGKLNIQNADGADWKAQLYQNVSVQSGARYSLTFQAKATGARPLRVALRNSSSYSDVWSKTVNLTPSNQTFGPFTFTADAANNRQLIFYAGQSSKDVFVDNVVLEVASGAAPTPPSGGKTYPYGGSLAPSQSEADTLIRNLYAKWKRERLVYAPNKGLQPGEILLTSNTQFNNGMVSEGIGYGMLLSVYNNDKATFDGIWKFGKRNLNQYGLLPWIYNSNSRVVDPNNATDGDLDAAFALIVANQKGWGYAQDARNLVDNILEHLVTSDNVLERGRANNPKDVINTSYVSPGYFKVFAEFTGNRRWLDVASTNYAILERGLNNYTLLPHDVNTQGNVVGNNQNYDSDAARGPWRLATDYVWYGDSRAQTLLKKFNTFFESSKAGGLSNLCESYDRFGNKVGSWCGSDAGWMIQGAASAQLAENDSAARREAWNALSTAFTGNYYSFELTQLGVLLTSGRFYNPLQ